MKNFSIKMVICLVALLFGSTAYAGFITVTGGQDFDIVDSNDFKTKIGGETGSNDTVDYNIGGNLSFNVDGVYSIEVTVLGQESGYFNFFSINGNRIAENNPGTPALTLTNIVAQSGDLLDFFFGVGNEDDISVSSRIVQNGANNTFASPQSFASILDGSFDGTGFDVMLFWDDSGASQDDNHDDMIVGINIVQASEPGMAAVLMLGLALLGFRKLKS